jgi:hypothetical protein
MFRCLSLIILLFACSQSIWNHILETENKLLVERCEHNNSQTY